MEMWYHDQKRFVLQAIHVAIETDEIPYKQ